MVRGRTVQIGIRFPEDVVELIDEFRSEKAEELMEAYPGLDINRVAAIRMLVEAGLRYYEYLPDENATKAIAADLRAGKKPTQIAKQRKCDVKHVLYVEKRIEQGE